MKVFDRKEPGRDALKFLEAVSVVEQNVDDSEVDAGRSTAVVFVLDESGSMSGQPYEELRQAYRQYIQRRLYDQGVGDRVSVVLFASRAQVLYENLPIENVSQELPYRSGGTAFSPAMDRACDLIGRCYQPANSIHMIFMTDGGASDAGNAAATLQRTCTRYQRLKFTGLAVGSGASIGNIQTIANGAGKRGSAETITNFADLKMKFVELARDSSATDTLYRKIGQTISEKVESKLMMDFL